MCGGCGQAALVPAQPLVIGSEWVCTHCGQAAPEADVKQTVSELLAELKHLTVAERYNVEKWLELDEKAATRVHPQHEVQ